MLSPYSADTGISWTSSDDQPRPAVSSLNSAEILAKTAAGFSTRSI
jgi:hypothetical protein